MKQRNKYTFLFAGGGTGGHLFPAIAVAEKLRERVPQAEIMFIGTRNKIEGTVVPKMGFRFKSIWVKGFSRGSFVQNLMFPVKLLVSTIQSLFINIVYQPKLAIGSGGYVSGPAVYGAYISGAKVMLLEQNSYPGITTRILERYADEIHIAFEGSKKYLKNKSKIMLTGNPVRNSLNLSEKSQALLKFNLSPGKKTLLVLGGSLGAKTINQSVEKLLVNKDIQIIWQTGRNYFEQYKGYSSENIFISAFIDDMNAAYSACDLLISRAGATTIAEITSLGIPSVLIPSPNVAENHQYHNAKFLADSGAAVLLEDKDAAERLASVVENLIINNQELLELKNKALKLGKPDAADIIADRAIKIVESL
jgi:UDP-N-acetylglucosamine--N-acetylmuramyl-(pentapeptide) pyrophosphoryl-undecaprenol N-acetylglucosamine transferase